MQQFNRLKVKSTLGFPNKIQHTGSKHFKMGIYENTFRALLPFETHSMIWAVTYSNSHCTMYQNYVLLMYTGFMIYFDTDRRVSASGRFWRGYLIMKTQVKTCISWTYLCSGDFKRQSISPFCARVCRCFQRLAAWVSQMFSAARDVIWTARGISIIIEGNAPARATAKPSMIKWFHLVPPEYFCKRRIWKIWPIKIRFFRYFDDNHYIIHTYHAWPSQMHSNLWISGVKTLAIARVLRLINKFSCICEGQSWWVRITYWRMALITFRHRSYYCYEAGESNGIYHVICSFGGE